MTNLKIIFETQASGQRIAEIAPLVAAGFGRPNDASNLADTEAHLNSADVLQYLSDGKEFIAFAAYKNLGSQAVELSGIVVQPDYQLRGNGETMVQRFIDRYHPEQMIAYARNPGTLRIMGAVGCKDNILTYQNPTAVVASIPNARLADDGNIYHFGRYGAGLYGDYDPADREYLGQPLKELCPFLNDPGNALAMLVQVGGGRHD
jgi:GNAT superfamily N-acetyltransferase